jgi:hypothetical protein
VSDDPRGDAVGCSQFAAARVDHRGRHRPGDRCLVELPEGKTPMPPTSTTAPAIAPHGPSKPALVLAWYVDGARLNARWITTDTEIADTTRRERVA